MFFTESILRTTKILSSRISILLILGLLGEIGFWTKISKAQVTTDISLKSVEFVGNTVFPDSALEAIVDSYRNQSISVKLLQKIQQEINTHYRNKGYISSESFLPSQEIQDGVVKVQIIEGTLEAIQIRGLSGLSEKYLLSQLPKINTPLNINYLFQSLERLQNNPLIKKVEGEIVRESLGKNILLLEVKEASPFKTGLNITDAYSSNIGSFGGNISLAHHNLLGYRDRLTLERSQTEGLRRTGGSYSFPLNKLDGRIILEYTTADSEIIQDELKQLGVEADFELFAVSLNQPVLLTEDQSLTLGLKVERIESETFVLRDISFSFTEGLPDGRSQITALRLSQNYHKNWIDAVLNLNSQFSIGLDLFDSTTTSVGIDSLFWSWQGDFQYLLSLSNSRNIILATRIATQLTPDKLLPIEQITVGGQGTVRGIPRNLGVADNGVILNAELQFALVEENWGTLWLFPFFDLGTIWNNDRETAGANTFASVGLGLSYRLKEALEFRVDYGIPLLETEGFGDRDTDNFTFSATFRPL